ncbi:MAG: hypothetical protein ABI333_26420 [bacterium]
MYDLGMWQEFQLSDDPQCERSTRTNDRYIVFNKNVDNNTNGDRELKLLDLENGSEVVLASAVRQVGSYFDIGERYVVWSGYATEPGSVGRDIYFYDLETEVTDRVPFSMEHYTYFVHTSGDRLAYMATADYTTPPFFLVLHDMTTGDHTVIADNDYGIPEPHIHGNLMAWHTTKYTGGTVVPPVDVELYDIETGVHRRLTTRESNLSPAALHFPYLLLGDLLELSTEMQKDWYVANLVELGVTDTQGNLIPGGAVLEPPR